MSLPEIARDVIHNWSMDNSVSEVLHRLIDVIEVEESVLHLEQKDG